VCRERIANCPIYRLGVREKHFAKDKEWIMHGQQKKGLRKFWVFVFLLIVAVALLFWLEWMGSEQKMKEIEQPVPIPAQAGKPN